MSNMSYCRFRNTEIDLIDCLEALEESDVQSWEEYAAMKCMFRAFLEFCEERGIVKNYENKLDNFFKEVREELVDKFGECDDGDEEYDYD